MIGAIDPTAPPSGPALASPATKAAFRRYVRRRLLVVPGGILWAAALGGLSPPVGSIGLLVSLWGVLAVGNAIRIGWRLRHEPWRPFDSRFQSVTSPVGGAKLLFVPDPERSEADMLLELIAFRSRWSQLSGCAAIVWVAGDPERGCVVAMPGGTHFAWARRPWRRGERERLRRILLRQPVAQVDLVADG